MTYCEANPLLYCSLLLKREKTCQKEIYHKTKNVSYCVCNRCIHIVHQKPIDTIVQCGSNYTYNTKTKKLRKNWSNSFHSITIYLQSMKYIYNDIQTWKSIYKITL